MFAPLIRKKRVNPIGLVGVVRRPHWTGWSSLTHLPLNFFRFLKIQGLRPQRMQPFALSTWPLVWGWATAAPSYVDLLFVIEVDKCAPCELGAVVNNDHAHDPILVYDFFDELNCCLRASCSNRLGLNPLGELCWSWQISGRSPRGRWEFPDKVKSPDDKGPCDWDRLEFLTGDVFLLGIVLTSLTSPNDVLCLLSHGRPIKPLLKGLTHQGV
jgi:hypothetical protein